MMELVFRLTIVLMMIVFYMIAGIFYLPYLLLKWVFGKIFSSFSSNKPYVVSFTGTTGEEYEHYVAERLKHMGFTNVQVTQLSGDFGADVLAYDPDGNKTCIQCKMYSGTVGIAAVQEIYGAKAYYKCDKAMVITTSSFTKAARQLALETDVKLVGNFK